MHNNKIALAQINPIIGNIEYNKNKIIDFIKKANDNNVDLIIFPKFSIIGYPFGDILKRFPYIINQINVAIDEIKKYAKKSVLIGSVDNANKSKFIFMENQAIEDFDTTIKVNDTTYEICDFDNLIHRNIQSDEIICLASCASRYMQEQKRYNIIKNYIQKSAKKFIWVNLAGANTEYVFDGLSKVYDQNGNIIAIANAFEEDFLILDNIKKDINFSKTLNNKNQDGFTLDYEDDLERTYLSVKTAIKDYFSKNGFCNAVLGLSGGLDSTICAVLLTDAIGAEHVYGISMPSLITTDKSKNDAKELAQNLGINFMEIPLKNIQNVFKTNFIDIFNKVDNTKITRYKNSYTWDNIQARARAMILWGFANEYSSVLPVATSDKSEIYMGYATINGDMSGGYAPICDIVKTKLFALAKWLNKNRGVKNAIPKSIIEKPPGAELAINPKTGKPLLAEEALMPYEFLDEVIYRVENYNQSINDMMKFEFLYEKKYTVSEELKSAWLEKFFKRYNNALYKSYILPPGPIEDSHSINKTEFYQPITSKINYMK